MTSKKIELQKNLDKVKNKNNELKYHIDNIESEKKLMNNTLHEKNREIETLKKRVEE